jgi:hypothetical protein
MTLWTKPTLERLPEPAGKQNTDPSEAGYGVGRGPS